jgi:hypothetical protein
MWYSREVSLSRVSLLPTMRKLFHSLAVAAVTTVAASADVVISNFNAALGTGTAFGTGASTQYKAFGFTMGSTAYVLDEVVLSMNFQNANPTPVVSIWSDNNGTVGTQLFTLDNPATLAGQMDFTFTAGSLFRLEANTSYWMHVASNPTTGVAFLWDATSPSTLPSGIATAIGYEFNGASSTFRNRLEIRGSLDGLGTSYCTPAANSTGVPGQISASGSNAIASNDVTLEAADLPQNSFGFFLTSRTQGFVAMPGGSQGNLCLAGSIGRYVGAGQVKNSGAAGAFSLAIDLNTMPQPNGAVAAVAGDTWNFQAWYRDAVGGVPTSNFADGLEITFQ